MEPKSALLVIDVQNDFCHPEGAFATSGRNLEPILNAMPQVRALVSAARNAGITRIFTQQTNLPDGGSNDPAWAVFRARVHGIEFTIENSWGWEIATDVSPTNDELVVRKWRSDAFLYSPLELLLRGRGITHLIVCGFVTEGCVLYTALSGSCRGFEIAIVNDAVASTVQPAHDAAMVLTDQRLTSTETAIVVRGWRGSTE